MVKIFSKFTKDLNKKVIFRIMILAIIDLTTMAAPFYLKYIIPNIYQKLGVTQAQFDSLSAALGWVVLITQIPGGWLADKISNKKMLMLSLFLTSVLSIWWTILIQINDATIKSSSLRLIQLYIIYIGWGFSTTFLFWTPLWKLLSQQGDEQKQGAIFGLQGTLNGLFGLIFIGLIGTIVTFAIAKFKIEWPFFAFSYMLAAILFIMLIATWIFLEDKTTLKTTKQTLKQKIVDLFKPMKNMRLWLLAFFVLGMYMFQSVFAYYMKELIAALGLGAIWVVILTSIRSYGVRMIVSGPFGKWADRRKSYILVAIWILLIGLIFAIIYTVMPGFNNWYQNSTLVIRNTILSLMIINYLIVGIFSWLLVAIRYVQMIEIPIAKNSYASSIAIVSFVAFSVDAWFYQMASAIGKAAGDNDPVTGAYSIQTLQIILSIAIAIIILGLICGTICFLWNKKELRKIHQKDYRWRKLQN